MHIIFAQPAFPSFYSWLKFLQGFSIFIFRLEIHPEKWCSIRLPILCKDFQKVSDIIDVGVKMKKRIHYRRSYTVYNFIHFSHEGLQIFLMNCRFIFSPHICWNSLLVSFLYVSLGPLSWTLLINLLDGLEQYIQTSGQ